MFTIGKLFHLTHVVDDLGAVDKWYDNIFAATRKEADSDSIRFMPVARLGAVMVITRSGRYLDDART